MITSLYQSLCNMETNIADRVALRWYDEEKQGVAEVHYAQYAQDLRRFVAFLRAEYGDVRGKRVAILARNSYQYVICMYGTVIAEAVAVPLNLGKDWDAISYELGLTEPVCILQDGEFAEREPVLTETYGSILKPMDVFAAYEPACRGRDRGGGPLCSGLYHVHLRHHRPQQGRHAEPEEPVQRHAGFSGSL